MALLRKIGSGLLFALAVLTFLICLTGVLGAWYAKATVDQASLAAIGLVTGYVEQAGQTLDSIDGGLSDAQQSVATFRTGVENLAADGADGPVAQLIQRTVADDLLPRLERLATAAERLRDGVARFNESVERLNRLPFVELPSVGDELAAVNQQVAEIATQANELREAIASLDGSRMLAVADRLDQRLSQARTTLAAADERLTRAATILGDIQASLTFWSTVGTGALTVLLILFAAGQASLAAHAWKWMRASGKDKAPTPTQAGSAPARP